MILPNVSPEEDIEVDPEDATVTDLKESKYGKKSKGYSVPGAKAKLFASVTGEALKGLEWCKNKNDEPSAEYKMNGEKEVEPVMAATKKNNWPAAASGSAPYFEVQASTEGQSDITFTAYVGATNSGPRDYQLSYAVGDSEDFTDLTDDMASISLAKNKTMTPISAKLPADAEDQTLVKIRVTVSSLETVESTAETPAYLYDKPTKGEAAINHISFATTKTSETTEVPEVSPAAPTEPAASQTTAPTAPTVSQSAAPTEPTVSQTTAPTEPTVSQTAAPTEPTVSQSAEPTPPTASQSAMPALSAPPTAPAPSATPDGGKKDDKVVVSKVKLNKKKLTLKKGKSYQLKYTVTPNTSEAKNLVKKAVKWTSSKKKVVTVSKKGKLKAKKQGKATITLKYSKKIKATCKVTVKKK